MKLKYIGGYSAVEVPDVGTVARGEVMDVPDEMASCLLKQAPTEWQEVRNKVSKYEEA